MEISSVVFGANNKMELTTTESSHRRLLSTITGFFMDREEEATKKEKIEVPTSAKVGQVALLPKNIDFKGVDLANVTNSAELQKEIDKNNAKGLDLSYATYTGDLSDANYSNIRQGVLQERKGFKREQTLLIESFHEPVFKRFLEYCLNTHQITPKEYTQAKNNFRFVGEGWECIDPLKEAKATEVLAERLKDLTHHQEKLHKEQALHEL